MVQMFLCFHKRKNLREDLKIVALLGLQLMFIEESYDLPEVFELPYSQLFSCVVIHHDLSNSEELMQFV